MQREFDRSHGFPFQFESEKNKYLQISKDLIGLMGEIGEFANLIKKINLAIDKCEQPISQIIEIQEKLPEELIDSLIYLIRIASILDVDLLGSYINKLKTNREKYRDFENDQDFFPAG